MKLLLDSHAFLWSGLDEERLPSAVRELLFDVRTRVYVSVASTWELTIKALAGRLRLPTSPVEHFADHIQDFEYELLSIQQRHVDALVELPAIHGDPFDRMIVAQALVEDLDLVTGDDRLRRYPVAVASMAQTMCRERRPAPQ